MDDNSLTMHYSLHNAAKHAIAMTSLSIRELVVSHPTTFFIHVYPGAVKMGIMREFGTVTRVAMNAMFTLSKPWMVPLTESGDRHLYGATNSRFPPRASNGAGEAAPGADGIDDSGACLLHWDGTNVENQKVSEEFRKNKTGKLVWEHTVGVFEVDLRPRQRPVEDMVWQSLITFSA